MLYKEDIKIGLKVKEINSNLSKIGKIEKSFLDEKHPYVIVRWDEENYSFLDIENITEYKK